MDDNTDAWFIGFDPDITVGVWIGFDDKRKSLGTSEQGSLAALPMWMEFMKVALAGHEGEDFLNPPPPPPRNAVAQKVDTPDENPGDGEAH